MIVHARRGILLVVIPALAVALLLALGWRWYSALSRARQGMEDMPLAPGSDGTAVPGHPGHETPPGLPREEDAGQPRTKSPSGPEVEAPPGSGAGSAPGAEIGIRQGSSSAPSSAPEKPAARPGSPAESSSSASGESTAPNAKTVAEVWEEHEPKFAALEKVYAARVDLLLERASLDYEKYKGSRARLLALAPRYLKTGLSLEKEADVQFYAALDELAADLRANSLPTDLVSHLERQYKEAKESRRKAVLDLARKALGFSFSWHSPRRQTVV